LDLIGDGSLLLDSVASMRRILLGFALGSFLGFVLGLVMGISRIIRYALDPYVHFFRFISGIAWVQFVTLWLGLGESSKIILVVYVTVFVVAINTLAGFRLIPVNRLRAARSIGVTRFQLFLWVEMPSCIHFALQGMRLAMAGAFLTVVAAEMIAANSGLGFLINSSRQFLATDVMFVGIFMLGLLGYVTDKIFLLLSDITLRKYRLVR
jgi:NitT/TauT family transport system permease protein